MEEWGHFERQRGSPRTWIEMGAPGKNRDTQGDPGEMEDMEHPEGSMGDLEKMKHPGGPWSICRRWSTRETQKR